MKQSQASLCFKSKLKQLQLLLKRREVWWEEKRKKFRGIKNWKDVRKYNNTGADKVKKSRTSSKNIYQSYKNVATEGFGINLCFLKRGCLVLQDGEFSTALDFLKLLLIHNLLERVIRTMKFEGEREQLWASGVSRTEGVQNWGLMLLGKEPRC